jgi:hypothetical protein
LRGDPFHRRLFQVRAHRPGKRDGAIPRIDANVTRLQDRVAEKLRLDAGGDRLVIGRLE